jgi:hypothetical protein
VIWVLVDAGVVAEDDVIDRDAEVEPALGIEVDDLVRPVRWDLVTDIAERAAVAHRLHRRAGRRFEAEELSHPGPVEAVTLWQGVFARGARQTVHDRLRHQQAIDDASAQGFVDIQVIPLPHPQRRTLLRSEIEGRVDLVLAVREKELHR